MGRKHRSSSLGSSNNNNVPATPTQAQSNAPALAFSSSSSRAVSAAPIDLAACHALLNHFVHEKDAKGRTILHRAIEASASSSYSSFYSTASASSGGMVNNNNNNYKDENEEGSSSSTSSSRLDGFFLIDALSNRMKELDSMFSNSNSCKKQQNHQNNNKQRQHHFHRILLAKDSESGYTSLHHAVLQRDLSTLLLLLKHITTTHDNASSNSSSSMLHPLRLLDDGNINVNMLTSSSSDKNNTNTNTNTASSLTSLMEVEDEEEYHKAILKELATSVDHEHLTPLQLLGRTSASGLEHCRQTLRWKNLKRTAWNRQRRLSLLQFRQEGGELGLLASTTSTLNGNGNQNGGNIGNGENPRRYYQRRRMISFGNERDHDSFNYDIHDEDEEDGSSNRERRARSNSFNVDLDEDDNDNHHDEEEADENENDNAIIRGANVNDLVPLENNANFGMLGNNHNNNNEHGNGNGNGNENGPVDINIRSASGTRQPQRQRSSSINNNKQQQQHLRLNDEYGCEVMTFGSPDHAALGVPQFTTSGRIKTREDNSFSLSSASSYKPKRVETFALGELRRQWSSLDYGYSGTYGNHGSAATAMTNQSKDIVDSPAVAIAASTHHTLVSTSSGQLYSFGLGKGGRLGTGDETHRPLPTRIWGQLTRRIVASIAAAENHSLCSTSEGSVFAWGSNGFGQLGTRNNNNSNNTISSSLSKPSNGHHSQENINNNNNSRLSPRRVEGELKQVFVVAVAAGDRHSVALTRSGEVYCWGDNRSGQLGMFNSLAVGSGASSSSMSASLSSSQANGRCSHRPQRVESLWSSQPRKRAIAISAAEFSTLVLTMPPTLSSHTGESGSLASLPVNTIYGWGHGNHSPMRVNFPSAVNSGINNDNNGIDGFGSRRGNGNNNNNNNNANVYARLSCINPTAIACAKYHNVAITADGRVYTWGLHSESLGIEKASPVDRRNKSNENDWSMSEGKQRPRSNSNSTSSSSNSSSSISSPQLVAGMLPENGGGKAVAVSASESHTAVVTSDGHLFTWGTSHGNAVLGHKGVRWQPSPRKVKRVHRAVGVAAAKEHTALLMGTSFPPLPVHHHPQMKMKTVEDEDDGCFQPLSLQEAAAVEISRNVDLFNVIPIALVAHRLNCLPLIHYCESFISKNLDGVLAVGNKNDFTSFLSSRTLVGTRKNDCDGPFHPFLYRLANSRSWMEDSRMLLNGYAGSIMPVTAKNKKAKRSKKEDRGIKEKEDDKINNSNSAKGNQEVVRRATFVAQQKETSSGKKSGRIPIAGEQKQQLSIEDHVPRKLFQGQSKPTSSKSPSSCDVSKYRCDVCSVSCPDSDSYMLHVNGRKHRNRLMHAKAEEEKTVAESMMAMKRMQLMETTSNANTQLTMEDTHSTPANSAWGTPKAREKKKKSLSEKKARSKSFQDILKEEQKRLVLSTPTNAQVKLSTPGLTKTPPFHPKSLPPITAYNMKKSSPIAGSPGPSLPLSAFMKKNGVHKHDATSNIGASWGTKPVSNSKSSAGWATTKPAAKKVVIPQSMRPTPLKTMKSFSQIQQEEKAFRSNEDHMSCINGNEWFVQQRERAASMGEIQEQEKKDREMEDLIEEQRQIEVEIMRRVKQEKKEEEKETKKNKKEKKKYDRRKQQQQGRRKAMSQKKSDNVDSNKSSTPNGKAGSGKPKKNPTPNCNR